MTDLKRTTRTIQSNLIAGILTVIPLIVVWLVLDFIFSFLFAVGSPVEEGMTMFIMDRMPQAAPLLENELFQWFVAVVMALLLLYSIGAIASRMVGKRLIAGVEGLIARIPVVETVYSASKKLINVLQQKPDGSARVVLLDFPQPGMKAIGLVMRVFTDSITGEELAAVYVPTTPNPTSGYLEIVPVRSLVPTAMTMDQAMTMIVSGGAVAPENFSIAPVPAVRISARLRIQVIRSAPGTENRPGLCEGDTQAIDRVDPVSGQTLSDRGEIEFLRVP